MRRVWAALAAVAGLGLAAGGVGCSGSGGGGSGCRVQFDGRGVATVTARPGDLDAAVGPALSVVEYASLERREPDPGQVVWDLVNLRGDPGSISIEMDLPLPEGATPAERWEWERTAVSMQVRAQLERDGDANGERRLVRAIVCRLKALDRAGLDPVPVRQ